MLLFFNPFLFSLIPSFFPSILILSRIIVSENSRGNCKSFAKRKEEGEGWGDGSVGDMFAL